jgi:hypothetical protein
MKEKVLSDALKIGIANLVIVSIMQNVFPKQIPLQLFLTATIFHITTEYLKVNDFYLEQPEYINTSQ